MKEQNIKCYIRNVTPHYEINTPVGKCDNPSDILLDYSTDEYYIVEDYIRDTALEKAKQLIGQRPLGIFLHPGEICDELFNKCDELVENNIKDNLFYVEVEEPGSRTIRSEKIELPEELYDFGRDGEGNGMEMNTWGKKKNETGRKSYTILQRYIFAALVAKSDIDLLALEKGDIDAETICDALMVTLNEYANTGFYLMQKQLDENPDCFFENCGLLQMVQNFCS